MASYPSFGICFSSPAKTLIGDGFKDALKAGQYLTVHLVKGWHPKKPSMETEDLQC